MVFFSLSLSIFGSACVCVCLFGCRDTSTLISQNGAIRSTFDAIWRSNLAGTKAFFSVAVGVQCSFFSQLDNNGSFTFIRLCESHLELYALFSDLKFGI